MREKPQRRTIWVPSDDTMILKTLSGAPDTRSLVNFSVKAVNHHDAERSWQETSLAAASEQALLQGAIKPIKENEKRAYAYIQPSVRISFSG